MKIIDIKKDENKGLVHLYFESNEMITMDEEDYFKFNIYVNQELEKEELDNLKIEIKYKMAKSIAFKYIVRQLRSIKEVYNKLNSYKFSDYVIYKVIDELKSMGYLNDRMYAHKYIFDRIKNNPKSKKMLVYELKQKGIDREIINEVVDEMCVDDLSSGLVLAKKRLRDHDINEEKNKKKIMSYLRNRGYNMELIKSILKNL